MDFCLYICNDLKNYVTLRNISSSQSVFACFPAGSEIGKIKVNLVLKNNKMISLMRKIALFMLLPLMLLGATRASAQLKVADINQAKADGKETLSIVLKSISEKHNHYFMTGKEYSKFYVPGNCDFTLEFASYNGNDYQSEGHPYFRLKRGDEYLRTTASNSGINFTSDVSEAAYYYAVIPNPLTFGDCAEWAQEREPLIRFVRADRPEDKTWYLNCGDRVMKYATGTGGYSAFYVYTTSDTDSIISAHSKTGSEDPVTEWPLASDDHASSSSVSYNIKNTVTAGVVDGNTLPTKSFPDFCPFVLVSVTGKPHVYKLYNEHTKKYLKWKRPAEGQSLEAGPDKVEWGDSQGGDESYYWWVRPDEVDANAGNNIMDILPYGEWELGWSWNHTEGESATSMGLKACTDEQSKWFFSPAISYSTADEKKYYTIQNKLNSKYADYTAEGIQLAQVAELTCGSYWYFMEAEAPEGVTVPDGVLVCKLYNAANKETPLKDPSDGTFEDQVYYISYDKTNDGGGYVLSTSVNTADKKAWNSFGGENSSIIGNGSAGTGSVWRLSIVADETVMLEKAVTLRNEIESINTNKDSYLEYIKECGTDGYYAYPEAWLEKAHEVFVAWEEDIADLQDVLAIGCRAKKFISGKTQAPQDGDYIWLRNRQYGTRYLTPDGGNLSGSEGEKLSRDKVWKVVGAEGGVKLKNVSTGQYIKGAGQSTRFTMVDEENATVFAWENPADWYAVFRESGSNVDRAYGHLDSGHHLVGWEASAPATQWAIFPVTKEALVKELVEELKTFPVGDALGEYHLSPSVENFENSEATDIEILLSILPQLEFNMPKPNTFLRVRATSSSQAAMPFLSSENSTVSGKTERAAFTVEKDEKTIFYYDDSKLVAYTNGMYLKNNSNFAGYGSGASGNEGTEVGFQEAHNGAVSAYNISFKGNNGVTRWLYTQNDGDDYFSNAGNDNTVDGYNFCLEEVETLPVKIVNEKKFATFWSPVALTVPAGVDVYTVEVDEEENAVVLTLRGEGTVLPAETGVLLHGEVGTYDFSIVESEDAAVGSLTGQTFLGSFSYVEGGSKVYTLQTKKDGVNMGFRKYTGSTIPAFKAYLDLAGMNVSADQLSLILADDDATGIGGAAVAGADEPVAVYDLAGRRVTTPKKGVYIVNGTKVLIK